LTVRAIVEFTLLGTHAAGVYEAEDLSAEVV
jgi:hypothetical protein